MKEVVRLPPEEHRSLVSKRNQKGKTKGKGRSSSQQPLEPQGQIVNDYEGWDDTTDPKGLVLDYNTQEEVERRWFISHCNS